MRTAKKQTKSRHIRYTLKYQIMGVPFIRGPKKLPLRLLYLMCDHYIPINFFGMFLVRPLYSKYFFLEFNRLTIIIANFLLTSDRPNPISAEPNQTELCSAKTAESVW